VWAVADPFGIDANDLPLYRMLQCYRETLQTTLVSNTPSALPNVTLYVAVKKMRKTLPGDYVLKPGTPEHENMNRLCILKTCVASCPHQRPSCPTATNRSGADVWVISFHFFSSQFLFLLTLRSQRGLAACTRRGGTMDEYLQPATDVERQIEIERKRAMLENLRCVRGLDVPLVSSRVSRLAPSLLARDVAGSRLRSDKPRVNVVQQHVHYGRRFHGG